jgi:phage baseplate assembly protein V
MWNDVNRRINQALNGIRKAFRAVIGTVDSSARVQTVQAKGLLGELVQDAELFQHYGFTSVPLAGTMGIILPLGGHSSHGIIIATEHGAYRLASLKPGEVALYTDEGAHIVLKRGKIVEVECTEYHVNCDKYLVSAKTQAAYTTPELTASAQVIAQGQISGNGGLAIKGGSGAAFEGNVKQSGGSYQTDGDVKAGTVSLTDHEHPNGNDGKPTGKPIA